MRPLSDSDALGGNCTQDVALWTMGVESGTTDSLACLDAMRCDANKPCFTPTWTLDQVWGKERLTVVARPEQSVRVRKARERV